MEELNLCEILKDCIGQMFYTTIYGDSILLEIRDSHIVFESSTGKSIFLLSSKGKYGLYDNGECVVFPSKDQRDWSKFEKSIPIDTPMMCRNKSTLSWILCTYKYYLNGRHYVKKICNTNETCDEDFNYMIPFNRFDPNNIEESLKYNIQK